MIITDPKQPTLRSQQARTIIRIGKQTMDFAVISAENKMMFEPYVVKSGMSMAANLREAFRESDTLATSIEMVGKRVTVLLDAQVLLIPLDEYSEADKQEMYCHSFNLTTSEVIEHQVLAELNCVAVFAINKDLKMVITDKYEDVRIMPLMVPVWSHLYIQSNGGSAAKLYVYFHDRKIDIMAFNKKRLRFANSYKAETALDASYFILYVFKQLAMDQKKDEIFVVGRIPADFKETLQRWATNVFVINPIGEYNRHPVVQIKDITYDMVNYILD